MIPNTWVVIRGSYNPHSKYRIHEDFLGQKDRFYLETDTNGVTVRFATSEMAMEYAIQKYGLHRARVAQVPMLLGDSTNGYYVEPS